ncbi:MAG: aldehyde dehydrogenase (NADP(+)) [Pirellulales bacterium]|nr:aldehyde dehydrogenase (NADP(+)) [Pirellulales bacterium]
MSFVPILVAGRWQAAQACGSFTAENPANRERLPAEYPTSTWADLDAALDAAARAAEQLATDDGQRVAAMLEQYAERIEKRSEEIVSLAHQETALAIRPRLAEVELPRTTGQLRQAAAAAREGSWRQATIDSKANLRSCYRSLGPVAVFGPNNFPLAFNGVAGGDFAAALAAGNPVIAKAHPAHPGTTRLLAEEAHAAADAAGLPAGSVQMLYHFEPADGLRLVADPRLGATGFTGSRQGGLRLKAAADAAGKPIYLEMSSINPVVILPGALTERGGEIASEFAASCLMAAGQFCTNPGLVLLVAGPEAEAFITASAEAFRTAPVSTLLTAQVEHALAQAIAALRTGGAQLVVGGTPSGGRGYSFANTLLRVTGEQFLQAGEALQAEAFGNASLVVVARDVEQAATCLRALEGNLTGCVYSARDGRDEALYDRLAPLLQRRVGRLLNDKMPTGVAVSPAMNHGGPFPATGHPGFTSVGIPASLRRFAALASYDNVREHRLPAALRNANPNGRMWRLIDGAWTQGNL